MTSFDDVSQNTSDSINLKTIDGQIFTISGLEDSAYTEQGKDPTPGVKITTEEFWKKVSEEKSEIANEGDEGAVNKLHTTRRAVVSKLKLTDDDGKPTNAKLHEALASGETFKVKVPVEKVKPKGKGLPYFDLIAAE